MLESAHIIQAVKEGNLIDSGQFQV